MKLTKTRRLTTTIAAVAMAACTFTYTIEYETKAPSFTVTNSAGVIVYQ